MGHIKMMAATQPFLSGAISKTVNLPHECTVEDIAEAYVEAWRLGLKAVAIYRDGSKGVQALNTSDGDEQRRSRRRPPDISAAADRVLASLAAGIDTRSPEFAADLKTLEASLTHKVSDRLEVCAKSIAAAAPAFEAAITKAVVARTHPRPAASPEASVGVAERAVVPDLADQNTPPRAIRHRLPEERASLTHKFSIAGHEGYITVGLYPTGEPGEIFIRMAKEGSTVSGLMDSFATAVSLALQHGVPLSVLVRKVRPHPLRALRLDRQRADRLRQEHHGLHLPLAPAALPLRTPALPLQHVRRRHRSSSHPARQCSRRRHHRRPHRLQRPRRPRYRRSSASRPCT